MSKKVKVIDQKSKELEVNIIIPDEVLNEDLSKHYNKEEQKLTYVIGDNYTDDFVEELKDVTSELNAKQLAEFNPIVTILKDLDEIKTLKPTGDFKRDAELLKEANKFIRSFNGTNKRAKDTIKKPILELGKKVQSVYNLFDNESKNTKDALSENFKDHIEKVEEEKRKKEEAKKAEELARIKELEESNREANEKMENQKLITNALKVESTLKDIFINATKDMEVLNIDGLKARGELIKNNDFDTYVKKKATHSPEFDMSMYDDDQIENFRKIYKGQVNQTIDFILAVIDGKLKKEEEEKDKIKEEAVKEASSNSPQPPISTSENSEEDVILDNNGNIKEEYQKTMTDEEMFNFLFTHFKEFASEFEYYHRIAMSYVIKDEETDVFGVMITHFKETLFKTDWMKNSIEQIEQSIKEYKNK